MRTVVLVSAAPKGALDVAGRWCRAGDEVTVVLLDAAVTSARSRHGDAGALHGAVRAGVTVLAEAGALTRRGLDLATLAGDVKPAHLDEVADLLVGAAKAVWL